MIKNINIHKKDISKNKLTIMLTTCIQYLRAAMGRLVTVSRKNVTGEVAEHCSPMLTTTAEVLLSKAPNRQVFSHRQHGLLFRV